MGRGTNPLLGLVVGPLFLLVALLMGGSSLVMHLEYAGAPEVRATVLVADYDHTARGTRARTVTLNAPDAVPLDDLTSAPDDLRPGETVTALVRPGHALLPSQLRWSVLLVPAAVALMGVAATALGIAALREAPVPVIDPESWD